MDAAYKRRGYPIDTVVSGSAGGPRRIGPYIRRGLSFLLIYGPPRRTFAAGGFLWPAAILASCLAVSTRPSAQSGSAPPRRGLSAGLRRRCRALASQPAGARAPRCTRQLLPRAIRFHVGSATNTRAQSSVAGSKNKDRPALGPAPRWRRRCHHQIKEETGGVSRATGPHFEEYVEPRGRTTPQRARDT